MEPLALQDPKHMANQVSRCLRLASDTSEGIERMMLRRILALGVVAFAVLVSGARAGAKATETPWGNQTELSCVKSSGNSEVTTFSGKNKLTVNQGERVFFRFEVEALYGESDNQRNLERYQVRLRGDCLLAGKRYAAGFGGWNKDSYAGVDAKYYAGCVGGYKFLTGPKHHWLGEAGLDYVSEDSRNDIPRYYLRGRFFTEYEYHITKKNRFLQSAEYLHDFEFGDNYTVKAITSLTCAVNSALSLKASYEVYHDSRLPREQLDKTDTLLTVALVVNI